MSIDPNSVRHLLDSKGLTFVSAMHLNQHAGTVLLEIPRERVSSRVGPGKTSERQLKYLEKEVLSKFGLRVIVAFSQSDTSTSIEAGLRAGLHKLYEDIVISAFLSYLTEANLLVWVEVRAIPSNESRNAIERFISSYLTQFQFSVDQISFFGPISEEPSIVAVLRVIKTLAPVELGHVANKLRSAEYLVPSEDWLSRKLDAARKRGLVLRDRQGRFVLTYLGLEAVPNTRTRDSSDVDRILWINRRSKW